MLVKAIALMTAKKRVQKVERTVGKQIEMEQSFNQRIKFQVWNRQTDLGEKFW